MRTTRLWITLICCLFAASTFLWGQAGKPGLWELTTIMTWQQTPLPDGASTALAAGVNSPFAPTPRTTLVCLTQAEIDRYGGIVPSSRGCQIANVIKRPNGMSADWECSGTMSGKGIIESSWSEEGRAKSKVHFVGSLQTGANPRPIEWTAESTSIFKSADCGTVKPLPTPDK